MLCVASKIALFLEDLCFSFRSFRDHQVRFLDLRCLDCVLRERRSLIPVLPVSPPMASSCLPPDTAPPVLLVTRETPAPLTNAHVETAGLWGLARCCRAECPLPGAFPPNDKATIIISFKNIDQRFGAVGLHYSSYWLTLGWQLAAPKNGINSNIDKYKHRQDVPSSSDQHEGRGIICYTLD